MPISCFSLIQARDRILISTVKMEKLLQMVKPKRAHCSTLPGPTKFTKHANSIRKYIFTRMHLADNLTIVKAQNSVTVKFEWIFRLWVKFIIDQQQSIPNNQLVIRMTWDGIFLGEILQYYWFRCTHVLIASTGSPLSHGSRSQGQKVLKIFSTSPKI